ncbi:MAG TPA: hypothetical protein VK204_10005 [Nocardioidaceae bacterium]|nr:hypothetical protein [Nocardioidaceae bacterium]
MSTPLSTRVPRLAEAAVERARLTVVPRRTQKAPKVPFVTLVSLLLVGGVVGLLLFNTNMQQASFVATSMEERAAVLAGKEESLRMQLHRLRDPQNVAAHAKKLGMVPASSPAFIRLSDGKVLGRPEVAAPTDVLRITPLPPAKPRSLRPELVILKAPKVKHGRGAEQSDTAGASADASRTQGLESRTKGRGHHGQDAEQADQQTAQQTAQSRGRTH